MRHRLTKPRTGKHFARRTHPEQRRWYDILILSNILPGNCVMAKLKGSFPSLLSCFVQLIISYLFFASVLPASFELSPAIQPWLTDSVIQWSKFQLRNCKTSRLDNAEKRNSGFQKPHRKPRLPSDQGEKGPWMFFSLLDSAVASSVFEVGFHPLSFPGDSNFSNIVWHTCVRFHEFCQAYECDMNDIKNISHVTLSRKLGSIKSFWIHAGCWKASSQHVACLLAWEKKTSCHGSASSRHEYLFIQAEFE